MAIAHMPAAQTSTAQQRAYAILYAGYVALPLIAGVDKFLSALTDWTKYLAPQIPLFGLTRETFMQIGGVIEMTAGGLVAIAPKIGGWVVALWLWGIVLNLLMLEGYQDIVLRDFGLSLGAIALTQLAKARQESH